MKTPIYLRSCVHAIISFTSCNKTQFNTNNSTFEKIHNQLVSDGYEAIVTMDTEVHCYNLSLSETKILSSIGYENNRKLKNTDYLIEIINTQLENEQEQGQLRLNQLKKR